MNAPSLQAPMAFTLSSRLGLVLLPVLGAIAYPFMLIAFHRMVGPPGFEPGPARILAACLILLLAFGVPLLGMVCAARPAQPAAMRRLAYATVTVPTLYVFVGVLLTMWGSTVPDELV